MGKKITVSDIISIYEISKWRKMDISFIEAGTGQGKSYFVINTLYEFAKSNNKKILFLINRSSSYEQFLYEIMTQCKKDIIDIATYQKLEYMSLFQKIDYDMTKYDYIVCDEFHYFLNDATFNDRTDIAFEQIMKQRNAVKIFMSATGENMERYIKENIKLYVNTEGITIKNYNLPINYDFIKKLSFFYKDETYEELIEQFIKDGTKAIFFMQNLEKACDLYKKYKAFCLFNCSKKEKKYYRHVNEKKIKKMLEEEKFEELILITTPCMDSGVNIKDINLKNIVVSIYDLDTLIQCIGRKRSVDYLDIINLYVRCLDNCTLGGIQIETINKLERLEYLKKHTDEEYIDKYPRSSGFDRAIYDNYRKNKNSIGKEINPLIEFKYKLILKEVGIIKSYRELGYGKFAYIKYLSDKFKINNYVLFEDEKKEAKIQEYFHKMEGERIDKEERKNLIEVCNKKDSFGRKYASIGKLNKYLLENNFGYEIKAKIIKNKTYWIIVKR